MNNFWNERYSPPDYVYGKEPNVFFAEQLIKLKPGKIILPCEGEGRNAIFAASKGWKVDAFDASEMGRTKALQLAERRKVSIHYVVEEAAKIVFPENSADVVGFIYAHFLKDLRRVMHHKAMKWLKPGGRIILEAFNPEQLNNNSGGPKDLSMLYTEDIIREDFAGLKIDLLQTLRVELKEGKFHEGAADVIRFVGIKI